MISREPTDEDDWVLLQACTDPMAAQVMVGMLSSEGIPARVKTFAPIPGLQSNPEVQVPRPWLLRAQGCLEEQRPTDEELTELAERSPPPEDADPPR